MTYLTTASGTRIEITEPLAVVVPNDVRHRHVEVRDEFNDSWLATCSVEEFVKANGDEQALCSLVLAMAVGDVVTLGGGAAPLLTVRRVR